jgi:hypothetical protein
VVAGVELEGAPEDAVPDGRVGFRTIPERKVVAEGACDRLDDSEHDHPGARPPERGPVAAHDSCVDRVPD